jgi:hypothetical protein
MTLRGDGSVGILSDTVDLLVQTLLAVRDDNQPISED